MKLYALRRISDGKFFVHTDGRGHLVMSDSPVFWKTPSGIWVNIKRVCSVYTPYEDRWGFAQKDWKEFDKKKLAAWEVVVTNVKILGEAQIPAQKFVEVNALRKMDARTKKTARAA